MSSFDFVSSVTRGAVIYHGSGFDGFTRCTRRARSSRARVYFTARSCTRFDFVSCVARCAVVIYLSGCNGNAALTCRSRSCRTGVDWHVAICSCVSGGTTAITFVLSNLNFRSTVCGVSASCTIKAWRVYGAFVDVGSYCASIAFVAGWTSFACVVIFPQ